jgi:hypothetical protein
VGMSVVMAVLAAMVALDTHTSGIVAAAMIFLYQAFYTWVRHSSSVLYSCADMFLGFHGRHMGSSSTLNMASVP